MSQVRLVLILAWLIHIFMNIQAIKSDALIIILKFLYLLGFLNIYEMNFYFMTNPLWYNYLICNFWHTFSKIKNYRHYLVEWVIAVSFSPFFFEKKTSICHYKVIFIVVCKFFEGQYKNVVVEPHLEGIKIRKWAAHVVCCYMAWKVLSCLYALKNNFTWKDSWGN